MRHFAFDVSDGRVLKFVLKVLDVYTPKRPLLKTLLLFVSFIQAYNPVLAHPVYHQNVDSTQSAFETITATCIKTND